MIRREWIPNHAEISFDDYCKNTYIRVKETGKEYYNVWAFIEETGEKQYVALGCMKDINMTTSKGHHIVPYRYDDGYKTFDFEV